MDLKTESHENTLWVHLDEPRLDAAVALRFKDNMRDICLPHYHRIMLDMSAVTFLDSSGLGALVAVMKSLSKDQTLELAAPSFNVSKVLRLTRMDTVFTIHATLADARAAGGFDAVQS
ncbi:STAS domain-containing protein [Rhodobacteraceae bacterium]|nr:STAS domain-containing protein [Paracoccaceae bacterium]